MPRVFTYRLLALVCMLSLAACSQPEIVSRPAPLQFSGSTYALKVGSITVTEDYKPSRTPPHVEGSFDLPPGKATKQLLETRLAAAAPESAATLEASIVDASVVEKDLPKQKHGIEGWFTKEQTQQFDGKIEVELKIYSGKRIFPVAHVHASAQQSLSLREDATLEDRQNLYRQMTTDLIHALEPELDRNIHQYFTNYLQ